MTSFSSIRLSDWRQFDSVEIDFHSRLTVITGSNGAGKSTILNLCSQHFGYSRPFLATPKRKKGGGIAYDLGYFRPSSANHFSKLLEQADFDKETEDAEHPFYESLRDTEATDYAEFENTNRFIEIGSIRYSNGLASQLGFRENQTQAYGVEMIQQQQVLGVPISSHRFVSSYQQVQGLSLHLANLDSAYQAFFGEYVTRLNGGHSQFSPLYRMKETLITMAAFGEGNQHLERNTQLSDAFDGFGQVLRKVLPKEIGFQKIVVRIPDLVLKTKSGEFILDSSSGGVAAIIEIAWQLYLYSLSNAHFVATIDEPENHLHPSMQRSIIANLVDAFPNTQFIVATHSPFIVSAVEDSRVYALRYVGSTGESGFPDRGPRRVRSIALDQTKKAGNASKILQEVLGVTVSMPDWAAKRLESIIKEFEVAEINADTLKNLRLRLADSGFSEYYPEALSRLVDKNDQA